MWAGGSRCNGRIPRESSEIEIVNSWNLFNNFSEVVLRTIEFVQHVTLFPGRIERFKNGQFKIR
jgi:hypothetical protein